MRIEEKLIDFATSTQYDDFPSNVVEYTKKLALKTTAGMLAGSVSPSGEKVPKFFRERTGTKEVGIFGWNFKTSIEDAAFINGFFAHAAELEDDQFPCSTSDINVFPVTYPLAEHLDMSGKEFITASAVGMEVMNRVGTPVTGLGLTDLPFFGIVGSVISAAKCFDLTEEEMKNALGLGIGQSSGYVFNFGTDAHYTESATPCRNGVLFSELAREGFDGNPDIRSWLGDLLESVDFEKITSNLGDRWHLHNTYIKKYPCCFLTHRYADSVKILMDKHDLDYNDIEKVTIESGPIDMTCDRPNPTTSEGARFSFQHVLGTMMLRGDLDYEDFRPEKLDDPKLKEAREKVEVVGREDWPEVYMSGVATTTLKLKSGQTVEMEKDQPIGGPDDPLSKERHKELYQKYASRVLSKNNVDRTYEMILNIEDTDMKQLINILTSK